MGINIPYTLSGSSAAFLSQESFEKSRKFGEDLAEGLTRELGTSLGDAMTRLSSRRGNVHAVLVFLVFLEAQRYGEARLFAMGLRSRFNLRTKEDFIFFIVAVLNGYRPLGMEVSVPQRLARQSRIRTRLNSLSLRRTVFMDSVIRAIKSRCVGLALPAVPDYLKCGLMGIVIASILTELYRSASFSQMP